MNYIASDEFQVPDMYSNGYEFLCAKRSLF